MTRGLSEDPAARFESMDTLLASLSQRSRKRWPFVVGAAVLLVVEGGA